MDDDLVTRSPSPPGDSSCGLNGRLIALDGRESVGVSGSSRVDVRDARERGRNG